MFRCCCSFGFLSEGSFAGQHASESLEFPGGRWFDGHRFEERAILVTDGRFTFTRPARLDRVIDLRGGCVLPPFGEAHNHNFSGPWDVEVLVSRYLYAGVFYVQNPANVPEYRDTIPATALNTPRSIDVTFAITRPRGHPIALYEDILREGYDVKRSQGAT